MSAGLTGYGCGGTDMTLNTVADAGPAQNVLVGTLLTLDGSQSTGAFGGLITYGWTMVSAPAGSTSAINDPKSVNPTFIPDLAGPYSIMLTVTDTDFTQSVSTVTITASVANAVPVADAGPAQSVVAGTAVTLDGSASSDANGDPLTYGWSFASIPNGSNAVLSSPTAVNPTFTADLAGAYVLNLVVHDGKVNSAPATVTVTAVIR
jgi:hypothetical protein